LNGLLREKPDLWLTLLAEMGKNTDGVYYIEKILSLHQRWQEIPERVYSIPFEIALRHGHLNSARLFFENATTCDLVARRYEPSFSAHMTQLGIYIRHTLVYSKSITRLKFLLECAESRGDYINELFEAVWDDDDGETWNALQAAVFYTTHCPGQTKQARL
jgi:hypothetical protein